MRNQFFGDNRDLFKYDLILSIIHGSKTINHLTFIPMLTENFGTHGNQIVRERAKAGCRNEKLKKFLDECIKSAKRNIEQLPIYFEIENINITIYKSNTYFSHTNRSRYFSEIPKRLLQDSLIFVDPDNGLEIIKPDKKHICYNEIKGIYDKMDKNLGLMIYQHFPRENHGEYLNRRSMDLNKLTGSSPLYISDNEIIFFFLTKNDDIKIKLENILKEYNHLYSNLFYGPL